MCYCLSPFSSVNSSNLLLFPVPFQSGPSELGVQLCELSLSKGVNLRMLWDQEKESVITDSGLFICHLTHRIGGVCVHQVCVSAYRGLVEGSPIDSFRPSRLLSYSYDMNQLMKARDNARAENNMRHFNAVEIIIAHQR